MNIIINSDREDTPFYLIMEERSMEEIEKASQLLEGCGADIIGYEEEGIEFYWAELDVFEFVRLFDITFLSI